MFRPLYICIILHYYTVLILMIALYSMSKKIDSRNHENIFLNGSSKNFAC